VRRVELVLPSASFLVPKERIEHRFVKPAFEVPNNPSRAASRRVQKSGRGSRIAKARPIIRALQRTSRISLVQSART